MKMVDLKNKLGEIIIPKKWEPIGKILTFDREMEMSKYYYGTWELTLKERSPMGVNPSSAEDRFKTAGNKFGEKEHTLTIEELPRGTIISKYINTGDWCLGVWGAGEEAGYSANLQGQNGLPEGGQPHNNIHPVEVVYFYKRVA